MNDVRRSGLKLFLLAGMITVAVGMIATQLTIDGWQILGYGWGIPGAFALTGLVQLVCGVPFSEGAARWDALEGWQRGVLGTLIFIVAVALIFGAIFVFVTVVYGT